MLSNEQIEANKKQFLDLISSITIEGAYLEELIKFLQESDFFTAPASTQYHCNYTGGLCEHSLNVYNNLVKLANDYMPNTYTEDTLKVVGLLHDISKVNFYEIYVMNKKIYNEKGTKHDNQGKFDWFAQEAFKVKESHNRFLAGTHEENSMLLVSQYIPLNLEESVAILNHHSGLGNPNQNYDMSAILNRYPLLTLLHSADYLSTFINERYSNVDDINNV